MKLWWLFLFPFCAQAGVLYYDGSEADGTDVLQNVKRTEFLFETKTANQLRLCGYWLDDDGTVRRFEQSWVLNGSDVRLADRSIGSYSAGNFLIEQPVGSGQFEAIEVTRTGTSYFEYRYHHPALGFVDADGWIEANPSARLHQICE